MLPAAAARDVAKFYAANERAILWFLDRMTRFLPCVNTACKVVDLIVAALAVSLGTTDELGTTEELEAVRFRGLSGHPMSAF